MQDQKERPVLKDAGSYVDYIDDATWQRLVGALLNLDEPRSLAGIRRRSSPGSVRAPASTGLPVRPRRVIGNLSSGRW